MTGHGDAGFLFARAAFYTRHLQCIIHAMGYYTLHDNTLYTSHLSNSMGHTLAPPRTLGQIGLRSG